MVAHTSAKIVLYLFLSLLLSIVSLELKKKYKVPTFLSLILFGVLTKELGAISYQLESTTAIVEGTIAPVVQLAMVPCIIFEAAFTTDWYKFKKQIGQIFPLATTVVVLSSVLTAVVISFILNYNFSWEESLIIGLILSATDHVVVNSTLKEIHVTDKLESLLCGETLLNETTVLVIYKVLQRSIVNQAGSGYLFGYFLKLCFGGLAVGSGFALIMGFCLKRMINDYVQETNLTIVAPYLTFWLCDNHNIGFSALVSAAKPSLTELLCAALIKSRAASGDGIWAPLYFLAIAALPVAIAFSKPAESLLKSLRSIFFFALKTSAANLTECSIKSDGS